MAEQFLDNPQVGPALQEMGCGAVPQAVRPQIGSIWHMSQQSVNGRTDLPGIGATAPSPQEERGTADRRDELNADLRPFGQRLSRGRAERHDPFFSPFAEHPHDLAIEINVVEIAAHQLADPYAGRIEQFLSLIHI